MEISTVVIVSDHAFINGGQARVAIESALGLAKSGLRVVFFAAVGPADQRLMRAGVELVCLDRHDLLSNPSKLDAIFSNLWSHSCARALKELLARLDPATSIIHVHGWAKSLSPSIARVLNGSPHPVVYTIHEYFLACPNGGFYDYRRNEICTRRPLGVGCLTTNCDMRSVSHKIWRAVRQAVLWGAGNWPARLRDVIYLSETQRRAISPYFARGTRFHYLPNPVDLPPGPRVEAEKNHSFLYIGRLSPEKGGALFAEAAKRAGVQAVFLGSGEDADRIAKLHPHAELRGWVSPEEVRQALRQARALVFPSLWYETFGLVAYEALASGVPVICGSWTAASEVMTPYTGVIVPGRDVAGWADAISRLGDPQLTAAMSRAARAHMRSLDLSSERHLTDLRMVYEQVIPSNGSGRSSNGDGQVRRAVPAAMIK